MENTYFVTITGIDHYYGKKPFEIGRIVKLIKDKSNEYDKEAIAAYLPFIETIGYVANSTNTVYDGTISAGRLYDKIDDYAYARVMFVTRTSVIALVLDKEDVEETEDDDSDEEDDNTSSPEIISDTEPAGGKIEKSPAKKNKGKAKQKIGFAIE